jgi:hypothetical protein
MQAQGCGHISAPVVGELEARVQLGEVVMKTLAGVAIAVALAVTSAHAQTTILSNASNPPPINWADPIIRITTTFRIAVATKDTESMNDVKAQETGRRSLYGMAQGECPILSEMFKAECRLNSFTITSLALPPNNPPTSMMAASAIYELKPGGQAPGR